MGKEIVRVTVRIPREVHAQLARMASQEDRSLNWQIVQAMKVGVEQLRLTSETGSDTGVENENSKT